VHSLCVIPLVIKLREEIGFKSGFKLGWGCWMTNTFRKTIPLRRTKEGKTTDPNWLLDNLRWAAKGDFLVPRYYEITLCSRTKVLSFVRFGTRCDLRCHVNWREINIDIEHKLIDFERDSVSSLLSCFSIITLCPKVEVIITMSSQDVLIPDTSVGDMVTVQLYNASVTFV